jgi:hypothetical protein
LVASSHVAAGEKPRERWQQRRQPGEKREN